MNNTLIFGQGALMHAPDDALTPIKSEQYGSNVMWVLGT